MTLPALPKEIGNPTLDIHTLFLYLQRIRDQFTDSVTTTVIENTYSDENAQDAIGGISQDSVTIDVTYNDVIPTLKWDLNPNTSVQKIEVSKNSVLTSTRKRVNFLEKQHNQLTVSDDVLGDEVEISMTPYTSRLVASGETAVLLHTQCLVVSRYFQVQGTGILKIQGDATLQVI